MGKHYYALYDWTVKPSNPGHGFCNTKKVIAFDSRARRDAFVSARYYDMTVRAIKRSEAIKYAERIDGYFDGRGIELYSSNPQDYPEYLKLTD